MVNVSPDFETIRATSTKLLDFGAEGSKRMCGPLLANKLLTMPRHLIIASEQEF